MGHHHGHSHSHSHSHSHGHGGPTPERALWVALILNALFLILEVVVGLWTNSLALLSDAGHMISDVGALAVALIAVRLSKRTPSSDYSFGLGRISVLGGLINAISLVAIVVWIGLEAFERLQNPPPLDALPIIITGVAGLAVNLVSAWYLARSRDESVNTRGAMLHLLADALGSVAAIISAIAVGWFGLRIADPITSLIMAVLILVGSWPLLRDTVAILLQKAPSNLSVDAVRETVLKSTGVVAVEELRIWAVDAGKPVASAVIVVDSETLLESNAIADAVRKALHTAHGMDCVTLECRAQTAPPSEGIFTL